MVLYRMHRVAATNVNVRTSPFHEHLYDASRIRPSWRPMAVRLCTYILPQQVRRLGSCVHTLAPGIVRWCDVAHLCVRPHGNGTHAEVLRFGWFRVCGGDGPRDHGSGRSQEAISPRIAAVLFRPVDCPGGRGVVSDSRALTIEKPFRKAVLWACLQAAEPGVTMIAVAFSCAAGGLACGRLHAGIELSAAFDQDPRRQITCIRVADFQTEAPGTLREAPWQAAVVRFRRPAVETVLHPPWRRPHHLRQDPAAPRNRPRGVRSPRRTARRGPMSFVSRCIGARRFRWAPEFAMRLSACLSVPDTPWFPLRCGGPPRRPPPARHRTWYRVFRKSFSRSGQPA